MRDAAPDGLVAERSSPRVTVLAIFLVLATATLVVAGNGQPVVGLIPVLLTVVAVLLARLPLRTSAAAVLFIAVLAHNPGGRPMMDRWHGPLYELGVVLYNNLRLVLGVDILRFCALELLVVALAVVAMMRLASPDTTDGPRLPKVPLVLKLALVASFSTLVALIAYGILTGGNFRQLLWQSRQLGWLPILTGVFLAAFRGRRAFRTVGLLLVTAAVLRSLEALYFYLTVMRPQHLELSYIMTHDDSALFTVVFIMLLASLLEHPTRATAALFALATPILTWALFMNGRRLAYVGLLGAALALVVLVRPALKLSLAKMGLVLVPVLALYVTAGFFSESRIFAPIVSLRSVSDEDNASNLTREIENYNLVHTTLASPLWGHGMGHPYEEVREGASLERIMENYRYIAHNSVLWLWSVGGLLGFTLLLLPFTVGLFLAARAYRATPDWVERVGVLAAVASMIAYLVQSYGDMGTTSWMTTLLVAAGLALVGNVAALRGAYPSARPLGPRGGP